MDREIVNLHWQDVNARSNSSDSDWEWRGRWTKKGPMLEKEERWRWRTSSYSLGVKSRNVGELIVKRARLGEEWTTPGRESREAH